LQEKYIFNTTRTMPKLTTSNFDNSDYRDFINEIKSKIQQAQIKASVKVNQELIKLYWSVGKMIVEKQALSKWGEGLIKQIELDLKLNLPNIKGFSRTNLIYTRKFYLFYKDFEDLPKVQQLVGQLPWGHNIHIIDKIKNPKVAIQYLQMAIENNWARSVLDIHIANESHLNNNHSNNFELSLPKPDSDLAKYLLKDEYNFDFLTILKNYKEKELETQLVNNITKFLLELGKGFSYVGRQYKITFGGDEFYFDLLFYHLKLRRYIVIELKVGELKPEHLGQLGFYAVAIDEQIKLPQDLPTIGLLLVSKQNKTIAKIMVDNWKTPIGIAEYKLSHPLDTDIESALPTIDELSILNDLISNTNLVDNQNTIK
jgi:predicted nuclease of restriction endonuclease-like (RecB) superfamily